MHYAKVVDIRILKCPTLTNYFSVVYHPGCPKFCVGLRKLPKNLEKAIKEKFEGEIEEKNAKNVKGVFAKVKTGLKKFVLINSTIFALTIFHKYHGSFPNNKNMQLQRTKPNPCRPSKARPAQEH